MPPAEITKLDYTMILNVVSSKQTDVAGRGEIVRLKPEK